MSLPRFLATSAGCAAGSGVEVAKGSKTGGKKVL